METYKDREDWMTERVSEWVCTGELADVFLRPENTAVADKLFNCFSLVNSVVLEATYDF